ncbi:hypothetical protein N9Y08_07205 [Paracoccaceae bacterium]|nr:hypothetical protein [Euryarchaeota archaeon]MDB2599116.1 hypothetical protein [Paracoccaceae bacterium]
MTFPKSTTPLFLYDVARGRILDHSALNLFGFNREVGSTFETVWNDGGSYVYPGSALTMSIVSTSASDTMDVLINGLDASYNPISETVTLTGTTPVTSTVQFFRINSAIILSGSNVGGITISNGGTKYAFIEATLGVTQSIIYTVPAGYTFYIFRIDANSATATGSQYLTFRNVQTTSTGRTLRVAEATFAESQVSYDRQVPFTVTEKTDLQFEAKSSAGANEMSLFIEGILVKNNP